MILSTSDTVKGADLALGTKAWVLPRRRPGVKQGKYEPPYDWSVDEVSEALRRQIRVLPLRVVQQPAPALEDARLDLLQARVQRGRPVRTGIPADRAIRPACR